MTNFDFRKFAISSVGAVALSATCVLAAVGPTHANAPLTTADWTRTVERQISDTADAASGRVRDGKVAETALALLFDREGAFTGASVARSSGDAVLDRHAVELADRVAYPALPAGYRGRAQTMTMRLAFGREDDVARHLAKTAKGSVEVTAVPAPAAGIRIAAK